MKRASKYEEELLRNLVMELVVEEMREQESENV